MKLIYNVVINAPVDRVWNFLEKLENQEVLIDALSVDKNVHNYYMFRFNKKFKTNIYRTVLVDKKEYSKLSFCMVSKNLKITKTYFLSNNGIETYIKHYTKVETDSWIKKLVKYPFYLMSFRKKRKAEFEALQKQFLN